jgi:hypothetical protein
LGGFSELSWVCIWAILGAVWEVTRSGWMDRDEDDDDDKMRHGSRLGCDFGFGFEITLAPFHPHPRLFFLSDVREHFKAKGNPGSNVASCLTERLTPRTAYSSTRARPQPCLPALLPQFNTLSSSANTCSVPHFHFASRLLSGPS